MRIPKHCSFQHPQQLRFPSLNPKHSQPESHTNNLHFKKNLVEIGLPYQKLLNFGKKKSKFPTVRCPIFKHFEPIFVKCERKLHQKPKIYIIKPWKFALWAKNLKKPYKDYNNPIIFKYTETKIKATLNARSHFEKTYKSETSMKIPK